MDVWIDPSWLVLNCRVPRQFYDSGFTLFTEGSSVFFFLGLEFYVVEDALRLWKKNVVAKGRNDPL